MHDVTTLDLLAAQYPGAAVLRVAEIARALACAPQTIRNRLARGAFPIATFRCDGRRVARIADVAAYLDAMRAAAPRKRGRPCKGEQIAARSAETRGAR